MNKLFLVACIYFFISACSNQHGKIQQVVDDNQYRLTIEYKKENYSFDLSLRSFSDEPICIHEMSWSDEDGRHYYNRDDDVYVIIDGSRFHLKSRAEVYCSAQKKNGCFQKLMPGEEIKGKIYMRDFNIDADHLRSMESEPSLYFPFEAYQC